MFNRFSPTIPAVAGLALFSVACAFGQAQPKARAANLMAARRGFTTRLRQRQKTPLEVVPPPAGFELVHYRAPLGRFPAYVAVPANHRGRGPAILWIVGGHSNSISDVPWSPMSPDNDQSASAFPQAGVLTMYPSLRGGNNNSGYREGFYGEVNDVIAAANYLASRPDVDPRRIYLGGHSTGGTMALLTAESTPLFRAVFAFGPVARVEEYDSAKLPFDVTDRKETVLRSPLYYLNAIVSPTFVFEGAASPGNIASLEAMYARCKNPRVHFYQLPGLNHFSALAPTTARLARSILQDKRNRAVFSLGR